MELPHKPNPINEEVDWDKSKTIISKTDAFGTIDYVNEAFANVSGYQDFELVDKPHNIIRHPDMPKVVFKILWENLKKGTSIKAIVKNLSKSGRYYWVLADFKIVKDEDTGIITYFSLRKTISSDVIEKTIEPLYDKLLQIEKEQNIANSEFFLNDYLKEKQKTFDEFTNDISNNN